MAGPGNTESADALAEAAAAWVVRAHSDSAEESDWLALEAWLSQSASHQAAFNEAEAVWLEIGERAPDIRQAESDAARDNVLPFRSRGSARTGELLPAVLTAGASLAAACVAILVIQPFSPAPVTYATQVGERRWVALADGSRVQLNSRSRLIARVDRRHRSVTLAQGEAVFDVAKDPLHPFVVTVGDQAVTVVGTEFDVLRHGGRDVVTVNRGIVSVAPVTGGGAVRLEPGDQLEHVEGTSGSRLSRVSPSDVMAWRQGNAVYANRTLSDIAADLNRYFPIPIRVDERVARLTFSGVVRIDNEGQVIGTLQTFLPVQARRGEKEIVLGPR